MKTYTTSEIARRMHCSTQHIRNQIRKGDLKSHGGDFRHHVHHSDVVRWLISISWPAAAIRQMFPLPGPLVLVGVRDHLRKAFVMELPKYVPTLFDLALSMLEMRPWGVVVDLSWGGVEASRQLQRYSLVADRPILIGLAGDDGVLGGIFDVVIPDALPVGKIAQRIRAVRPWGK